MKAGQCKHVADLLGFDTATAPVKHKGKVWLAVTMEELHDKNDSCANMRFAPVKTVGGASLVANAVVSGTSVHNSAIRFVAECQKGFYFKCSQ